jgi:hypothetical protein
VDVSILGVSLLVSFWSGSAMERDVDDDVVSGMICGVLRVLRVLMVLNALVFDDDGVNARVVLLALMHEMVRKAKDDNFILISILLLLLVVDVYYVNCIVSRFKR